MTERDRLELEATEDHKAEQGELGQPEEDAARVAKLEAEMAKEERARGVRALARGDIDGFAATVKFTPEEDAAWVAELEAQMNKDRQNARDAAILTLLEGN